MLPARHWLQQQTRISGTKVNKYGEISHWIFFYGQMVYIYSIIIEKIILRGPRSSSFWFARNLSSHMYRQASTRDTVLEYKEMTCRSQTLPWRLGGRGKDDLITIYAPVIYTAPCIMFWMGAYTCITLFCSIQS